MLSWTDRVNLSGGRRLSWSNSSEGGKVLSWLNQSTDAHSNISSREDEKVLSWSNRSSSRDMRVWDDGNSSEDGRILSWSGQHNSTDDQGNPSLSSDSSTREKTYSPDELMSALTKVQEWLQAQPDQHRTSVEIKRLLSRVVSSKSRAALFGSSGKSHDH
jgi:hypothetical protein